MRVAEMRMQSVACSDALSVVELAQSRRTTLSGPDAHASRLALRGYWRSSTPGRLGRIRRTSP